MGYCRIFCDFFVPLQKNCFKGQKYVLVKNGYHHRILRTKLYKNGKFHKNLSIFNLAAYGPPGCTGPPEVCGVCRLVPKCPQGSVSEKSTIFRGLYNPLSLRRVNTQVHNSISHQRSVGPLKCRTIEVSDH